MAGQTGSGKASDVAKRQPNGKVVTGQVQMPTDPAALEREIDRRREKLAETIDELVYRTKPKEIARRSALGAQEKAKAAVTDDSGAPDPVRIGAIVAAVVALVALVVWRRRS